MPPPSIQPPPRTQERTNPTKWRAIRCCSSGWMLIWRPHTIRSLSVPASLSVSISITDSWDYAQLALYSGLVSYKSNNSQTYSTLAGWTLAVSQEIGMPTNQPRPDISQEKTTTESRDYILLRWSNVLDTHMSINIFTQNIQEYAKSYYQCLIS